MTHNFKKKFGQNFITDKNLLNAIVDDAQVDKNDDVLEIGAGEGTLTKVISERVKSVVSYEIDSDLKEKLLSLNLKNVKFVLDDIMKYEIEDIEKDFLGGYKIIANLPYYITSPIIFKFLNNSDKVRSLTIMVQKEVAERIVAKAGGKDYGVLSVMVQFFGNAKITRLVSRKMFFPQPNVDSAVVVIDVSKNYDIDKAKFYKFIQTCFSMRRKTLKNNLSHSQDFKDAVNYLDANILSRRAESFTLDEFIEIFNKIEFKK